MGFSRQEYWSVPFSSPGDPPNPGIKPGFPALQADSLPAEPPRSLHGVYEGPTLYPLFHEAPSCISISISGKSLSPVCMSLLWLLKQGTTTEVSRTTEIYSLPVLEAGSLTSMRPQG